MSIEPQDQTRLDLAEYIRLGLSNTGVLSPRDVDELAGELDGGIRIFVEQEIQRGVELRAHEYTKTEAHTDRSGDERR